MAFLDPDEAFSHFQSKVTEGISQHFPFVGKKQSLTLEGIELPKEVPSSEDVRSQKKAKVEGETWSVPVHARVALRDNQTGGILDVKKVRVAEVPRTTKRHSYIVGGQEWQVDNQWQLKPGVYTGRRRSGELTSQFNVGEKKSFSVEFDPGKKTFHMLYGVSDRHLPLYPFLQALGVSDQELENDWGKEVLQANKSTRGSGSAFGSFYKIDTRREAPDADTAKAHFLQTMGGSKLNPEVTSVTLGKPFSSVTGDTLRLASQRLLKVQAGGPTDDRDSLVFKSLRSVGDFALDHLRAAKKEVSAKVMNKVDTAKDVRDALRFDFFQTPVMRAFTKNAAARPPDQINPVEMLGMASQTTLMGVGGIRSNRRVTPEAKFVNESHFGFLDPVISPEGSTTGVILRLPFGAKRVGHDIQIPLYDRKTKKRERVSLTQFGANKVVLPDQVEWKDGVPHPISSTVRMMGADKQIRDGKFSEARYVLPLASQVFSTTTNLIPFLGSTSGNRAAMAGKQYEQAISLVHREAPLVQVGIGPGATEDATFHRLVGRTASHESPVDGKVAAVRADGIHIQEPDGTKHEVQLYDNYPLNGTKGILHSSSLVKPGDTVSKGQVIADTNFSKNGVLALGVPLRTAYLPLRGDTFEDGVVISETAAKKLTSEHLSKPSLRLDPGMVLDKKKFTIFQPGVFSTKQLAHLDDSGVVHVGAKVHPGDPLVAALKPFQLKDRTGISAIRRSLSGAHEDRSLLWEGEVPGVVQEVHKSKEGIAVHVHTLEPMQIGDKLSGSHGDKGIVGLVLPDHEMPYTKDGRPIELAFNPSGVAARMLPSQVLTLAAGKIAEKTGKPYIVNNFAPHADNLAQVQKDLKAQGISDTEELFDPVTKKSLGPVLVGPKYTIKLVHQVDKKLSVRSGMGAKETYDVNLQPSRGGGTGGQSLGALELYTLLAHGATANLRELHSYKSEGPDSNPKESQRWPSDHNRIWQAIATGGALPPPKPSFAFHKFGEMLRAAGVDMEKKGHQLVLSPLTDQGVLQLAKNALPKPTERLSYKVGEDGLPVPKAGGIFDTRLTGGHGGKQWTRISLAEPLPNPVFERPICVLTGLKTKEFQSIVHGAAGVSSSGAVTTPDRGLTGGAAIESLLRRIDVKKALPKAEAELKTAKRGQLDTALKKVKYLRALDALNYTPAQAYILHNLPVIPPVMRPVSLTADGRPRFSDLNELYHNFARVNEQLQDSILSKSLSDADKQELRKEYYTTAQGVMGLGKTYENAQHTGLLHQLAGDTPKKSFFQSVLMKRRQDLSMRSVIVPGPGLSLDEVGLPKHAAIELFKPFLIKKLKDGAAIQTEAQADALLANPNRSVWNALEKVMQERPVLLKRDPALHKFSVMAFRGKPIAGQSIQLHPLVTGGFSADFDGDTMSAFVPITREAVDEAHKMFPSNNLFNESTGKAMYQPTIEGALGLYKLSLVGKKTGESFADPGKVLLAARDGKVHVNDVVSVGGKETTAGRILLASVLPEPMQEHYMHNLDYRLDDLSRDQGGTKGLSTLFGTMAERHPEVYGQVANKLKDLGNGAAFGAVGIPRPKGASPPLAFRHMGETPVATHDPHAQAYVPMQAHTLSLSDFESDRAVRDPLLAAAAKKTLSIQSDSSLTQAQKDARVVSVYTAAGKAIRELHEKHEDKDPSRLYTMYKSGIKPGWDQYKQMVLAPLIYKDSADRDIPTPVTRNYAEGLDLGGYWTQMHGARRGAVLKTQEVSEPGAMSKRLMNTMMDILVTHHDCGTTQGVALPVSDPEVNDRYLQKDFVSGHLHIPAGTLITPDIAAQIKSVKKDAQLVVRSPMKCEEEKGVCQKCAGLNPSGHPYDLGTNLGVLSAQALGERAMQLTFKSFHTGGVSESGGGSKVITAFGRIDQLTRLPSHIPDEAVLARVSGRIEKITPTATGVDVHIEGHVQHVGKDSAGHLLYKPLAGAHAASGWAPPTVGQHVKAGAFLSDPSRTVLNPHTLFEATNSVDDVQQNLVHEIYDLYKKEGVRRRAVETTVKAMTNLTRIVDPGGHPDLLRGEYRPLSVVNKLNRDLVKAGKPPIEHQPELKGINVLPLSLQEDWMAKLQHARLQKSLLEAAAEGAVSNVHGTHPVPGLAMGSEFGLTSKDSLKPGYSHLKDVPQHHY